MLPNGIEKFILSQGLGMALGLIVLPLIYIYFLKPDLKRMLKGMSASNTMVVFLFSVLILFCSMPLIAALVEWNQSLWFPEDIAKWMNTAEAAAREATEMMVYQPTVSGFLLVVVVVGIIPAISEELVFRGLMQTELREEKWNMHLVIWVTAFIFSAIHMQFYGFFPRLFLGAMMGYIAWWTNSLSAPMIFHALNNIITVTAYNLYKFKNIGPHPEKNEFTWYSVIGSALITGVLIYLFRNTFSKQEPPTAEL